MASNSVEEVRARLKDELYRLLVDTIASSGQLSAPLVDQIVDRLEPRLEQTMSVTLDEAQFKALVDAVVAKLPEKLNRQAGQPLVLAGSLVAAVLAGLGIAGLIVAATLLAQGFGAPKPAEAVSAQVRGSPTIDDDALEKTWRNTVGVLVEEQTGFYREHAALICGPGVRVVDCQSYTAARTSWERLGEDRLAELKLVENAIVKSTGCTAMAGAPLSSLTAIDACLAGKAGVGTG